MSLIPARWRRPTAPLAAYEGAEVPEVHHDRLNAPRGTVVWVCATPTGRVGCVHETEAQAKWHGNTEGRVWWPVTIDEQYGETA